MNDIDTAIDALNDSVDQLAEIRKAIAAGKSQEEIREIMRRSADRLHENHLRIEAVVPAEGL